MPPEQLRSAFLIPHHFGLEAVRVTEENTEGAAEVSDCAIASTQFDQPLSNYVQRFAASSIESQVIDAATAEHGVCTSACVLPGT